MNDSYGQESNLTASERSRTGSNPLKARGLWALNLVLLGTLGAVTFAPGATAQFGDAQSNRPRGEYSVVGGASIGGVSSVVYVMDTANRELVALHWNDSTKTLEGVGYRDLGADATSDPDR